MNTPTAKGVSLSDVVITGGFWKQKQELFLKTTIDAVYDRFEETGRFEALKFNWKEGMPNRPHIFWESDVTKWIEGAANFLMHYPNKELEAKVDELVDRMVNTQQEDGYLNAYFTVVEPAARFTRRTEHELYCAGHLVEGAIAYAKATGKTAMLHVAKKYIDLIDRVFRIEHSAAFDTPGHQEIELALIKLYEYTGEERYRLLSEYFIETRGRSNRDKPYDFTDDAYMQSHLPVREQKTAEGHSVRALYQYCAMADLAQLNQDEGMFEACKVLFDNMVHRRMYITGGVGSTHLGEAFTYDFHLPEYTAYTETCASISLALYCKRMWLLESDGRYADIAEQAIYNTVLAGVSLSGDSFYYENPLAADPKRVEFNHSRHPQLREHLPLIERVKVFDCSCCPPNLLRMVGEIGEYQYSVQDNIIFTQLFMESKATLHTKQGEVTLKQITNYPYEGTVCIQTETGGAYTIAVRIPRWATGANLTVNGEEVKANVQKGFVHLQRNWQVGDTIELTLPMEVKTMRANSQVLDACGRVAVMRGPLVYCAEGADNSFELRDARLPSNPNYLVMQKEICGVEMPIIKTTVAVRNELKSLYVDYAVPTTEQTLELIPYFAWANRGINEMSVWLLGQ